MKNKTKAIPMGFNSLSPYLVMKDAASAIEFYKKAFGAKEIGRITMPDGKVGHAEIEIGNSRFMLSEEIPAWGSKSPQTLNGTPVGLCLYVEEVDEVFNNAIEAGAKVENNMYVKNQFYGDRSGNLIDPFGHKWTIATHIEDLSFKEMQKRSDALFSNQKV